MPVKLNSTGGGSVTLDTPSTASNYTITLPAATSTLLDTTSTQTLTNKTLTAAGSNTVEATSGPTSTQLSGNRNKIINGAMMIDQRFGGGTIGSVTGSVYTLDRWRIIRVGGTSTLTPQQSTVAPAGFINSFIVTVGSGATPATTEERSLSQIIEGLNVADLGWGTANALSVTLSFWARSSVTGTFGVVFGNNGASRSYVASYAINLANTWEYKTITIAGDTSGTWLTNNGSGLVIFWDLGVGPTYSGSATGSWQAAAFEGLTSGTKLSATTGATWYVTGVQLEKGATATPFENRLYGTELALCQRYCVNYNSANSSGLYNRYFIGQCAVTTSLEGNIFFPVQMRAVPSLTTTAAAANYGVYSSSTVKALTSVPSLGADGSSPQTVNVLGGTTGLTQGQAGALISSNNNVSFLLFTAEL